MWSFSVFLCPQGLFVASSSYEDASHAELGLPLSSRFALTCSVMTHLS